MTDINLRAIDCCKCHILFWVTERHQDRLIKTHEDFFCPSGHPQCYVGETEEQRLRKVIAGKETFIEQLANEKLLISTELEKLKKKRSHHKKTIKK